MKFFFCQIRTDTTAAAVLRKKPFLPFNSVSWLWHNLLDLNNTLRISLTYEEYEQHRQVWKMYNLLTPYKFEHKKFFNYFNIFLICVLMIRNLFILITHFFVFLYYCTGCAIIVGPCWFSIIIRDKALFQCFEAIVHDMDMQSSLNVILSSSDPHFVAWLKNKHMTPMTSPHCLNPHSKPRLHTPLMFTTYSNHLHFRKQTIMVKPKFLSNNQGTTHFYSFHFQKKILEFENACFRYVICKWGSMDQTIFLKIASSIRLGLN